ncbi:PLC-like phosphodiesterase [Ascodesmis nigricans]|uniref:Phosphoinositide phospholipase C n=1 Tax=Ascodesmis nigricans TaxID=341454 RepID=A0A4S2N5A7_9PEZI|nr:PLC-like phosphodiesterase [Ascodesmis nigricans]
MPTAAEPPSPKASLMRRVSQKAANKLRRRASSTSNDPEERSGPVVVRHRSGSTNSKINGENVPRLGIKHHDQDDEDEEHAWEHQLDGANGVAGLDGAHSATSRIRHPASTPDDTVGIIVPDDLIRGTAMTRVTRKKKTQRVFKLDINSARVSWDPSKPTSRFNIDDMKDVRTGANARNYREELQVSKDLEPRWITITYMDPEEKGKLKFLHVVAPTDYLFEMWTKTLEAIHTYRTEMMAGLAMQGEKFVDAHWKNYMAKKKQESVTLNPVEERLSFEDVERLCRRLHINCSKSFIKERFERAKRSKGDKHREKNGEKNGEDTGHLDFTQFRRFVKLLKEREEIYDLWKDLVSDTEKGMNWKEFHAFLQDHQKVNINADSEFVNKVFLKYCGRSTQNGDNKKKHRPGIEELDVVCMTREAFVDFLLSPSYNPPLLTATGKTSHTRPLNEYFISSSHNTYLMGRQVRGESSVEGYIRVLQRGCRCVEIDCWDGDDGRPIVTHGHTGTTEVLLADVITAIGKYAFTASPYPVILSLEVHCSLEQQVTMAELFKSILGDVLVTEPFITNAFVLPSPEELKNRILIKVKGSKRLDESTLTNDFNAMDKKLSGSEGGNGGKIAAPPAFVKGQSSSSAVSTTSESESSSSGDGKKKSKKPATKIAPELGALGVYVRGQKFRNFALPESKSFNHIFSFQEKTFLKFCKESEKKAQIEKHNVRYLMRVYPSGFRVNSSNFDPIGFWRCGVQMVALNWQTYDLGVQLNDAMFAAGHDDSGYVLKPKALRGSRTTFDPPADAATVRVKKVRKEVSFDIQIVSAQQLPRPKDYRTDDGINPFVEVEVFTADDKSKDGFNGKGGIDMSKSKGLSGLGAPQKRRSRVVRDDGFHPIFKENMSFTVKTKFEELVFVRFSIWNQHLGDDKTLKGDEKTLMASYTAKLCSLQQGYRHLPLYDVQGEQYLFSTLFVHIQVNPVVLIDDDPLRATAASTLDSIKHTAKSVLSRGKSIRKRKDGPKNDGRIPESASASASASEDNRSGVGPVISPTSSAYS